MQLSGKMEPIRFSLLAQSQSRPTLVGGKTIPLGFFGFFRCSRAEQSEPELERSKAKKSGYSECNWQKQKARERERELFRSRLGQR